MRYYSTKIFNKPKTLSESFHDIKAAKLMPIRTLKGTNMDVSILSLGASSIGSVFRETNLHESVQVIKQSVEKGINLIDTSPWYGFGKSEQILGKALRNVPRSTYYINTKVGRYHPDPEVMFDFTAKRTLRSIQESLNRMEIDYIDVIQVHDPEFCPEMSIILQETLPALQEAKDKGLVRFIGVTGYPLQFQKALIEQSTVKLNTSLCYCHYSLNDQTLLDFLPFLDKCNMGCINASPVSMGLLSNNGPPNWHPATSFIKSICIEAIKFCQESNIDISKLALHFSLKNNNISTTLCSTANLDRAMTNIKAAYTKLNGNEEKVLKHLINNIFIKLKGQETWEDSDTILFFQMLGKIYLSKTLYGKKYVSKKTFSTNV